MQQALIDSIKANPAYRGLVTSRRRFSFMLTALMVLTYYGFVFVVALAPTLLSRPLYAGATTTTGVVAGICVMLVAIGLTSWYVLRANRIFDPLMSVLLKEVQKGT